MGNSSRPGFRRAVRVLFVVGFFYAVQAAAEKQAAPDRSPTTIGWVESVVLQDVGIRLKARIDTGAGVSSLNARIIATRPAIDGKAEKIVFQIQDQEGRTQSIERTIVEWAKIKGKGTQRAIRRPVVRLDVCLGGQRLEGRVNLADRSGFLYPMLIGRNLLKTGNFLIDPRGKFMQQPGCPHR